MEKLKIVKMKRVHLPGRYVTLGLLSTGDYLVKFRNFRLKKNQITEFILSPDALKTLLAIWVNIENEVYAKRKKNNGEQL